MRTATGIACGFLGLMALAPASRAQTVAIGAPAEWMRQAMAQRVEEALAIPLFADAAAEEQQQTTPPAQTKPPNQAPPSLNDLGFPASQTQGNAQEQARLNKRSHMLKVHQKLGLITTGPLVATVLLGGFSGGHSTSSTTRDLHAALGSVTAGLYITTAYYSIFAPKIPGTRARGPIRLHKALAFIHGPGMILTPALGAMAFSQKDKGEKVHGIASAHGAVAVVTAAAYGLAILSVSVKF